MTDDKEYVSDSSTAGEVAFHGPTADFILYGVVNGSFRQGPPDDKAPIEVVNNPLPYWYGPVWVYGGDVGGYGGVWWKDGSIEGYGVGYMEQIVPIGKGQRRRWAVKSDGYTTTAFLGANGTVVKSRREATYLRIRVALMGKVTEVRLA